MVGLKCVYLLVGIHHYDLNMTQGNSGALELNGELRRVVALELGGLVSRRSRCHNGLLLAYYKRNVEMNSITVHSAQE
jgi:hypothetical protein